MMCQKNCGSTVQSSLRNMDLDPVISFLQRQLLQSVLQTGEHDNATAAAAVVVDVAVVTAEADFATSFASVVIQWGLVSKQQQQCSSPSNNNDLLDYTNNDAESVEDTINTLQHKLTTNILSTPK
eukprot:scaffold41426_cov189-Skeletonema_dohrnii-CCMP3373.AAC.1